MHSIRRGQIAAVGVEDLRSEKTTVNLHDRAFALPGYAREGAESAADDGI